MLSSEQASRPENDSSIFNSTKNLRIKKESVTKNSEPLSKVKLEKFNMPILSVRERSNIK